MPRTTLPTGMDMYYEVEGSGPPLLLIMGTASGHETWAGQVAAYRREFTVVTYDARGTGQSTHAPDPTGYTMASLADDAAALIRHLGLGPVHVSGLSLGSATAQELVLRHPDLVATVQLHCTWGRSDEWFCRMIDTMEVPVAAGDMRMYIRLAMMWVSSPHFVNERPDDVEAFERGFLLDNPHPASREGILGHFHADKTHDALDRLGRIAVPTLVTSGEVDWQVPARYGREVHSRIPGAEFHMFTGPRSSHIAFHEMAEEWNAFTLAWMREKSR
ncbi:MAG: alpha/beta fold hydrolase [Acidobacteria bacterium]|nr:alpha/beta fold hydrolase [Acidobacteriota bacterium]